MDTPTQNDTPVPQPYPKGDIIGFLALVSGKLILPFEELFRGELTMLQLLTLFALRENGECSVTSLADRLYVPKQQMTKLIARLDKCGHVCRRKHESDGRYVMVRLSDSTASMLNERHARFVETVKRIIEQYECEQDVQRFIESIYELSRILSALPSHSMDCQKPCSAPENEENGRAEQ